MADVELTGKHFKGCPKCGAVFDIFGEGQIVVGADERGLYLEHVPCGHRGRPGTGPDDPAMRRENRRG